MDPFRRPASGPASRPPLELSLVDARGMRCPWPALRLARAVAGGATMVELLTDDPIALSEIAALAAERGWSVAPLPLPAEGFRVISTIL